MTKGLLRSIIIAISILGIGFAIYALCQNFASKTPGPIITKPNTSEFISVPEITDKLLAETNGVLSPDGDKIAFLSDESGKYELWIMQADGSKKKQISNLEERQAASDPVWAPNSKLIAFTESSVGGHSPLTTTHVWVVRADGSTPKRIVLPIPYPRFSTYEPQWLPEARLRVKASVLEYKDNKVELKQKWYIYDYEKGEIWQYTD